MKDIDKQIEDWIEAHIEGDPKNEYRPAVAEWGKLIAKYFYNKGVEDSIDSMEGFTRMHQEMCHRFMETCKKDPDSPIRNVILNDIKEFERMMEDYMDAEMREYRFMKKFDFDSLMKK
jgi:hypothetical protein